MKPRNWIVLGLLSFFAFVPIAGCQAEPYPQPEPVVSNSPFDESKLYEFKRSCDSQLSAFDERLDRVSRTTNDLVTVVDNLQTRVNDIETKLKDDLEANQVPKIKPDSPVAKGKTYETEVLGWLKSSDASSSTVSTCPGGQCPTSNCPSSNCPTSNCPSGNCPNGQCPLQTVAEISPDDNPGHWTYPGTIDSHLKTTHGVDPSGLTREQKLTLHDQLHESAKATPVSAVAAPVYQSTPTRSTCPRGGCPPAQQSYTIRRGIFRR